MNIQSILRLKPLEPKHKLKEDYFSLVREQSSKLEESKVNGGSIIIHDPLKRSKDQFEFKFDKVYTQEYSNIVIFQDSIAPLVNKALHEGDSSLIVTFGHKDGGNSTTSFGDNNYQLQRNVTDPLELSDDSRGLILRCLNDIYSKDPNADVQIQFIDQVLDNIRDILKYVQKDRASSNKDLELYSGSMMPSNSQRSSHQHLPGSQSFDGLQASSIEKDFIEIHEKAGENDSCFYLKNVTSYKIKDMTDAAYIIEKGHDMSEVLNKKLNYTEGIRYNQLFIVNIRSSKGKESSIVFLDTADYDKIQTNVIDNQKLYEQIVLNNTFNALTYIIGGFNREQFDIHDAPFQNSKLTRIIQSALHNVEAQHLNVAFFCCIWPCEAKYQEVVNTLRFVDRIKLQQDVMVKSEYQGEMSTNQERIMQDISKENVEIKYKIDSYKREHQQKLHDLKVKLGLDVPFESILKSKGNQKELQAVKEHREAIEKTEHLQKYNRDVEKKLEAIQRNLEDDEMSKREIQEQFSQKYYILHKKINKLREEYKQCEMELDNTTRGQMNDRNEELQNVLNNTHGMLIENADLVDQLNATVIKKTQMGGLQSKRINFMKDEGKKQADDNYQKLLQSQLKEYENSLNTTKANYENLLTKKEDELRKVTEEFKGFHEKIKTDENNARSEIIKLYTIVKKQNQILTKIENGVYSQTSKKIKFTEQQKPSIGDESKFKFLQKSLEKQSQRGTLTQSFAMQNAVNNMQQTQDQKYSSINEKQQNETDLKKNVESMINPEHLREYVRELMGELKKHSSTHPQMLKGETLETILQETEKYKKQYEQTNKKNNDVRIQIEAQRRLIDRAQLEKAQLGQGQYF